MHLSASHKGGTRGELGRVVIRCTFLLRIKAAQGGSFRDSHEIIHLYVSNNSPDDE